MRFFCVAVLCTALAAIGFAHRAFAPPRDAALAQYLASGGTLGAICGQARDGKGADGQGCEACRLVDAAVLPETGAVGRAMRLRPVGARIANRHVYTPPAPLDPARLTRAPPVA